MSRYRGNDLPPELAVIEERLRSERPAVTGVELDELKLRAMRQARQARPRTRPGGQFLKSRLALLTMIVVGLMMSTTGAGLAISGSSGSGSAAENNYREVPSSGTEGGQTVAGQEEAQQVGEARESDEADKKAVGADQGTQDTAQTAASGGGDSLPFTGFLAIPLLIGGVALLGTGSVLRWRARD